MTFHTKISITCAICFLALTPVWSQPEFKYGLGAGINFTSPVEQKSYPLYEDLTGETYDAEYSSFLSNMGNQYFFHAEVWFNKWVIALKPGTYTQKFSNNYEIDFNSETVEVENNFLLRYLNFPLEVKYVIGNSNFKPFIGGSAAYGHLLKQSGNGGSSFIHPKIAAGPVGGAYYSFPRFDLVLTAGYQIGLHSITKRTERYDTSTATPYSQSNIKLNELFATLSILFSISKDEPKGSLDCPQVPHNTAFKKKKHKRKNNH